MNWARLHAEAAGRNLTALGGFHPCDGDDVHVPKACKTLILLGPDEPTFWPAFTQSAEFEDTKPDPMDRWSTRVITDWAETLGATPLFPFGGAPFLPFFSWATRTGRIHASPINFLVHDRAGLFVSFRGALALPVKVALPKAPEKPCDSCFDQPCLNACPVSALTPQGYDVPKCKAYLDTPAGADCMTQGCAARRACPVSESFGRVAEQSAFHMRNFKGG